MRLECVLVAPRAVTGFGVGVALGFGAFGAAPAPAAFFIDDLAGPAQSGVAVWPGSTIAFDAQTGLLGTLGGRRAMTAGLSGFGSPADGASLAFNKTAGADPTATFTASGLLPSAEGRLIYGERTSPLNLNFDLAVGSGDHMLVIDIEGVDVPLGGAVQIVAVGWRQLTPSLAEGISIGGVVLDREPGNRRAYLAINPSPAFSTYSELHLIFAGVGTAQQIGWSISVSGVSADIIPSPGVLAVVPLAGILAARRRRSRSARA